MIRNLLFHVLPFLLPFVIYGVYLLLARRAERQGVDLRHAPWYWLTAVGLLLCIASFFGLALIESGGDAGSYVPARLVDGEIVPGTIER